MSESVYDGRDLSTISGFPGIRVGFNNVKNEFK